MDKVIGRMDEYKKLESCMNKNEAQFIVVYGRRRVGKTFLINSFFDNNFSYKLTGIYKHSRSVQLQNFIDELNRHTGKKMKAPSDWVMAFSLLREYLESLPCDKKHVVFFDEMPWMDTPKSGFLSAFEWFWNSWGSSRNNLVFIACGSASSWLSENIDKNKGGLYNRFTCRIYLDPFTLKETEEYLIARGINWSRYTITECYMILGGIPFYLSLLKPEMTYNDNIDNMFFRRHAELWDEFEHLYSTLFIGSDQYIRIVETLSTKKGGMTRNEIIDATKIPSNGNLTKMLSNLEYSGFIRIYNTFGKNKKELVYQLSDYYSAFYFRFIKDHKNPDESFWTNSLDNPCRKAWAGLTFEQVCKDHIRNIKKALGISGVLTEISSWSAQSTDEYEGAQIDLVIDRRDHMINLCEIKYSAEEYTIDKKYDMVLRNKMGSFRNITKTKKGLAITMITTYGVKKNMYSSTVANVVTIDDLFV